MISRKTATSLPSDAIGRNMSATLYALYASNSTPMHAMQTHNSGIDCIQCIQEDGLAQE